MTSLDDQILAKFYLHGELNADGQELSYYDLFALLESPAGDKRLTIVSLNDAVFHASINRLLAKHYLSRSNYHGTHYLQLSAKGKLRAERWQTNLAGQTNHSAGKAPTRADDSGCMPLLIIGLVIGSGVYFLKDMGWPPELLCRNSAYKKDTVIQIERQEIRRRVEGFNSDEIGRVFPGNALRIVDGPKSAAGVCWWKVQTRVQRGRAIEDVEGWLPEKSEDGQPVFRTLK